MRQRLLASLVLSSLAVIAPACEEAPPPVVTLGQPAVAKIYPTEGPTTGRTQIAIAGVGFQTGATVKVGDLDCTDVRFDSANLLYCKTPAQSAGEQSITVTNPNSRQSTGPDKFTYYDPSARPAAGFAALSGGGVMTGPGYRLELTIGEPGKTPEPKGSGFADLAGLLGALYEP